MKTEVRIVILEKKIEFLALWFVSLCLFILLLAGAIFNMTAVMNNNNKMPVLSNTWQYSTLTHFTFQNFSEVNYPYLTDIFKVSSLHFSIGDSLFYLFIIGNAVLFILFIKKYPSYHKVWKTGKV